MDELKTKFNDQIRSLVPINGLAPQYQNEIIQQAKILTLKRRQTLFKQGGIDNYCFYLLDGELELTSSGQLVKTVSGGAPDSKVQLAQLQPRQLTATAKGKAMVLRLGRELLDRFLTMDDPGSSGGEMEVTEVESDSDGDWMTRLLQSELFSRIPPANIQRVFAVLESIEVKAGDVVIEQDTVGEYYYIIQHGRCEVSRKTESSGRSIKLAELSDGDCFGEEALVSGAKRNATVTMLTAGELMRLTKEDFIELIKKPNITTVGYETAKVEVAKGARWLDTRFPEEHANDGIEGSLNIPLNSLRMEMRKLDPSVTYIVYCDTGARSSAATFLLAQNGFDARHMEDGLYATPLASSAVPAPDPAPAREPELEPGPASAPESLAAPTSAPKPEPSPEPAAFTAPARAQAARPAPEPARAQPDRAPEKATRTATRAATPPPAAPNASAPRAAMQITPVSTAKVQPTAAPSPVPEAASKAVRSKAVEADLRASALSADVAKADTEIERAMQLKAELEAAKRLAAKKLKSERVKIETEAAKASAALEEVKRQRIALEKAKREAEVEAQRQREKEERRLELLNQKADERLRREKEKLEAEYRKQAEELAKLSEMKEQAKAEIQQERAELERKAADAKRERERAEQQSPTESAEEKIRKEIEERIRAERQHLEAEFARTIEKLTTAQREREQAAEISRRAAEQAAQIIAEQKMAQAQEQAAEEAKLRAEREKLKREAQALRKSLEAARRAKAEAEAAKRDAQLKEEEMLARDIIAASSRAEERANFASLDAEVDRARAAYEAAEAAHRQAEEAQEDLEDTQRWKLSEIDAMRKQLEEELSEFRVENPTPTEDSAQMQRERARMEEYRRRREAERKKQEEYNSGLLNEISSQLKGG